MSLSTNATVVLGALQQNSDPLSRGELAYNYGISETDVVRAINELGSIYQIERLMSGYRLSEAEIDDLPVLPIATPTEQILLLLSNAVTRIYPRTISRRLNLPLRTVQKTLDQLLQEKVVSHRVPGTYYLTQHAAAYLAEHYAGINISTVTQNRIPFEDSTDNYTFTISRTPAKRKASAETQPADTPVYATLTGIPAKISLLKSLHAQQSAGDAKHLADLITFLELHTEQ